MTVEWMFKKALEGREVEVTIPGESPRVMKIDEVQFDGCLTLYAPGQNALRIDFLHLAQVDFQLVQSETIEPPQGAMPKRGKKALVG